MLKHGLKEVYQARDGLKKVKQVAQGAVSFGPKVK